MVLHERSNEQECGHSSMQDSQRLWVCSFTGLRFFAEITVLLEEGPLAISSLRVPRARGGGPRRRQLERAGGEGVAVAENRRRWYAARGSAVDSTWTTWWDHQEVGDCLESGLTRNGSVEPSARGRANAACWSGGNPLDLCECWCSRVFRVKLYWIVVIADVFYRSECWA